MGRERGKYCQQFGIVAAIAAVFWPFALACDESASSILFGLILAASLLGMACDPPRERGSASRGNSDPGRS